MAALLCLVASAWWHPLFIAFYFGMMMVLTGLFCVVILMIFDAFLPWP